jgi:DNA-binding NtrC family response regulator
MAALVAYEWPGNVRQLDNVVERMVLLRAEGQIDVDDVPARMQKSRDKAAGQALELPADGIDLRDAVEQFENKLILQALERTGWNKNRAAAVLRMNRTTLVEKLKKKNLLDDSLAS